MRPLTAKADQFLFIHTRKGRIATAIAILGALLVTLLAVTGWGGHSTSAAPRPRVVADPWGQLGMATGALSSTGGCVVAPNPWSCGGAISGTTMYMDNYGNEPLHGDSDMTQDGPLPAL